MGMTFTDEFGPVLARSAGLHKELAKATANNAYLVHRNVVLRIRSSQFQGNYKSLSERYLAWKIKKNFSSNILTKTGDLGNSMRVWKYNDELFNVGTNIVYARAMELGNPKKNIPARPFFRPGFEDSIPQMKDNWKEALRRTFEK